MHFELHQIRSQELIHEADEHRLPLQARKAKPASRSGAASDQRQTPRHPRAWLRG